MARAILCTASIPILKRIDDDRKQIIFADDVAPLRTPRGYVEDVAAAIALAATSPQAAGRVYNVCETESFGELDWARKIAAATGWQGDFVVLPHDRTPKASALAGKHRAACGRIFRAHPQRARLLRASAT